MILRGADIDSQLFKENVSPLLPSSSVFCSASEHPGFAAKLCGWFLGETSNRKKEILQKEEGPWAGNFAFFLWKKFTLNAFVLLLSSAFSHLSCVRCREEE